MEWLHRWITYWTSFAPHSDGRTTMTWLEFLASVASSIAWPFFIFVALVVFRKEINDTLRRLARFEVGNAKILLSNTLARAQEIASEPEQGQSKETKAERSIDIAKDAADTDVVPSLINQLPDNRQEMGQVWESIRMKLQHIALMHGLQSHRPEVMARDLFDKKIINYRTYKLVNSLHDALLIAASSPAAVSNELRQQFMSIAGSVIEALRPTYDEAQRQWAEVRNKRVGK